MKDFQISPDDPKLTAYALGELEGDERAAIEAAVRANAGLRALVEDIRATTAQMESALAAEAAGAMDGITTSDDAMSGMPILDVPFSLGPTRVNGHTPEHVNGHAPAHANGHAPFRVNGRKPVTVNADAQDDPEADDYDAYSSAGERKLLSFPQFYYIVGGLAAACFAVIVALNREHYVAREQTRADTLRVVLEQRAAESAAAATAAQPAILVQSPTPAAGDTELEIAPPKTEPTRVAVAEPSSSNSVASVAATTTNTAATDASATSTAAASQSALTPIVANEPSANAVASNATFLPEGLSLLQQAQPASANQSLAAATNRGPRAGANASVDGAVVETSSDRILMTATGSAETSNATPTFVSTVAPNSARGIEAAGAGAERKGATGTPRTLQSTSFADARFTMGSGAELFPGPHRVFVAPATGAAPAWTDYSKAPAAESEVVTLSAFTVSAKRDSFAASLSGARRMIASADLEAENNYLPRPPPGARFGRKVDPSAPARDNDFRRVVLHPLSTFAADVDTSSYGNVRRLLQRGQLPSRDLVRIEELLNYFPYRYPAPAPERTLSLLEKLRAEDAAPPLAATLEVAEAPWAPTHRLVRIGLKGREVATADRERANLVFLLDVSSSMQDPNKLPLVKESLRLLIGKLRADDRVAIVTYAGNSGVALASTPVARAREIVDAIDALTPSGLADGATGIRHAYDIAHTHFAAEGINRVILCTDGDFNVGTSSEEDLMRLVGQKAGTGVFLSVLGFGMGNYKDATLEQLADVGNGTYGYIDSRREAQKLLVEQVSSTLVTIAKDVKVQVEFNPAKVSSYRLIGYENRLLRREDFNTDQVDAGEIGAGHTVTALYEIVPVGAESPIVANGPAIADLKYISYATDDAFSSRLAMPMGARARSEELLTVKVRYKKPDGILGRTLEFPLTDKGATFAQASADFRFAAAVAQFGMILRESAHRGAATIGDVIAWAAAAAANPADDPGGYRGEFIDLARQAQEILRSE